MKVKFTISLFMFIFVLMASTQVEAQRVTVTFKNDSPYTINSIQTHFCSSSTWGGNLLDQSTDHQGVLYPGESFTMWFSGPGCYDLKIVDEDGIVCEELGIQVNKSDNGRVIPIPDLTECHD